MTFRVLFCLVVLRHDRRRVLHFNATEHPTAQCAAQQLVEAFPEGVSARYLFRDRDRIYGDYFRQRGRGLGLKEVLSAPRSPWQNGLGPMDLWVHMILIAFCRVLLPLSASTTGASGHDRLKCPHSGGFQPCPVVQEFL